jgi:hypothetical protein
MLTVLLSQKMLTLAGVHQHASAGCLELFTLELIQHHRVQLIFITLTLMTQMRHMSHISHGPPTQDGRTKPRMSKDSHLCPLDGEHSQYRSQMIPDKIFIGAMHHFLCAQMQTTPRVDHTRSMHH